MGRGPLGVVQQVIRDHRRRWPARVVASAAEKYLRAYYNEDFYNFDRNGEGFAMRTFARWCGQESPVVWDVGANHGQWALAAAKTVSGARIHSFEIVPDVAEAFEKRVSGMGSIEIHRIGLSDTPGEVAVTWNRDADMTSSIAYRNTDKFGTDLATVTCPVSTVDRMIQDGLPAPVLLKIDTEGHDAPVLRGARGLLASGDAPAMIQFEYGETWLPARETLEQTHRLLEEAGYAVGRLFPDHVAFKAYEYADDNFRMGNMIAANDPELIALLSVGRPRG